MPPKPGSEFAASASGGEADLSRLLADAARGDEEAWRAIVGLYARRVFALAKSRVRQAELAEEVTQSVFCTVAAKLGQGGYTEQGRFESWLFRVAVNRVRDEIRRVRRHAAPTDPEQFSGVAAPREPGRENADLGPLREAMEALTPADREIVELRHHAGMSFNQIAEVLDEPLGTLLARHHRALKKLKDTIGGRSAAREEQA